MRTCLAGGWLLLRSIALVALVAGCAAPISGNRPQGGQPLQSAGEARAADCFPFERLPADLQGRASDLLLQALDGEGLYTLAANLKPMSSGFYSVRVDVAEPDLREADQVRQILRTWTCGGEIEADLHHFAAVHDGERSLEGVLFNLPALRRMFAAQRAFFGPYGISPWADPVEALMAIEYDPTPARLRGYGYFFGYPDYAVDFFAKAAEHQNLTGNFVPRDFISLPTARGERRFVYAAPKGHEPNAADRELRAHVEVVFADYMARRARHIKPGSSAGVLALVREWFDDGSGRVRPSNAWNRWERPAGGPVPRPPMVAGQTPVPAVLR